MLLQWWETLTWAYSELKEKKRRMRNWWGPPLMWTIQTGSYGSGKGHLALFLCFLDRISKCFQIPKLITPFILFYVYNQRSLNSVRMASESDKCAYLLQKIKIMCALTSSLVCIFRTHRCHIAIPPYLVKCYRTKVWSQSKKKVKIIVTSCTRAI